MADLNLNLPIFSFQSENQNKIIRCELIDNEPWFVAKDICDALGYQNSRDAVNKHVFEGDVAKRDTPTKSGIQNMLWISEPGVYALVYDSKLEGAQRFKYWIQHEVLPSIRKTGSYSLPQTYLQALKALVASEEEKEKLALENKAMKPKAEYFDDLVDRNTLTNFRDTAKEFHMKQNDFINWLLNKGFIYRDAGKKLKPYAPYADYFHIKEAKSLIGRWSGVQTLITPRGREAFRLMLKKID